MYLDKILEFYYNKKHDVCQRRRRKEVAVIDAFQRVTGWWEVMCQIISEYIPELHTEWNEAFVLYILFLVGCDGAAAVIRRGVV